MKTWRSPEALIDVTMQPVIFLLMFTYIFGGATAGGSQHDYLQFLLPGRLGQSIALGRHRPRTEPQHRHREGRVDRFRSLPIAGSAPLVGAVFADFAAT
jgi:oleandomycin transport system permease protein